jgi:hypothetical protein
MHPGDRRRKSSMFMPFKTLALKTFRGSDRARWKSEANLEKEWEPRTDQIAKWIPKGSRVIEFGSGKQMLKSKLDEGCVYVGSDFVKRNADTFLCDLNKKPLPDLAQFAPEVAVFSGVLEYVHDLPGIAAWLASQVRICIFSYSCLEPSGKFLGSIRAAARRLSNGWVNTFTEAEITAIFQVAGFRVLEKDNWEYQRLFMLEKQSIAQ